MKTLLPVLLGKESVRCFLLPDIEWMPFDPGTLTDFSGLPTTNNLVNILAFESSRGRGLLLH